MKKITPFLLFFAVISTTSCRDKNDDVTPENTGGGYLNINLQMTHQKWIGNDTMFSMSDTTGMASFLDSHGNYSKKVDSISLNGVNLIHDSLSNYYRSHISDLSKCIWIIKGKNGVPDFNYSNTVGMPDYTGYDLLPDSIDISKNLTIPCSGMTNTDNFVINLYSYTGANITTAIVNIGTPSVSFKKSELASLQKGETIFLTVSVFRENHTQEIGRNSFFLHNALVSTKLVKVY